MASWRDFKAFVRHAYEVEAEDDPETLQLVIDTRNGRSQVVFLRHRRLMKGTEDWVIIDSPFGEAAGMDLADVLERAGEMVVGGVVVLDGHVYYRDALPLENLDVNEFERPMRLVSLSADLLERRLSPDDEF